RGANVSFFPEHESEAQDKSAHEKQYVQVAIPGILRRRVGTCGSFRGGDRNTIYCGRHARLGGRGSWSLDSYATLGKVHEKLQERKDDRLEGRTTSAGSSTPLDGWQGKLKAEKSGRSKRQ